MDAGTPYVREITRGTLWKAWKEVRNLLPRSSRRDVTDFVEFDIDPDAWIARLEAEVNSGTYEPRAPFRFTLAKNLGFSRLMTFPQIPDLVLYRAITSLIYDRIRPLQKGNVYFARNTLSKKRRELSDDPNDDPAYSFLSGSAFLKWKEFHQYRKLLLHDATYPYFVLTDVANYFDSVLYARTADAIHGTDLDRNLVGLLFFLLERLSPRDPYNESPRIGLPVDEFDCSRTLGHVVLFPHDARMIDAVGEKAYVRWMDDQTIGVDSYADGVRALGECSRSLSRLHLTPNTAKSTVLSLEELTSHFHLEVNQELDELEILLRDRESSREDLANRLRGLWENYRDREQLGGEWKKVLLRFYRMAGICRCRFLRHRAREDILRQPTLAIRVADYMRVLTPASEYLEFMLSLCTDELQIYPDVSRFLAEGLLKVEAGRPDAQALRDFASTLLDGGYEFAGWKGCAAIAPLMILRFGDRRALPRLRAKVENLEACADPAIGKAVAVVYASYGDEERKEVVRAASTLNTNYLAEFLRMLACLKEYERVPKRFKIRGRTVRDAVAGQDRVDLRKLLVLRVLRLNETAAVAKWLAQAKHQILTEKISEFDRALVKRLLRF